jgi:hypothetical protein
MVTPDYIAAHKHAFRNRSEIQKSETCGCFYCLATFPPKDITEWLNEGEGTAFCPHCGIDAVIGSVTGLPITSEFLIQMQKHWFHGLAGQNPHV